MSPGPSFCSQDFFTLDLAFRPGLAVAMGLAVSKWDLFYVEAIGNLTRKRTRRLGETPATLGKRPLSLPRLVQRQVHQLSEPRKVFIEGKQASLVL
jgi:hypothetical protein